jgi:pyruvate/2-oxoglutarate dehydrogenase complex dihydrolipoamide acyltransferase (E2) component
MKNADIHLLTMPKWGLAMTKGKVVGWLIEEGAEVRPGWPWSTSKPTRS